MTEFVVDFNESLAGLARFQTGMTALGKALDATEGKTNKTVAGAGKLFDKMEAEYKRLEHALAQSGTDAEKLGSIMDRVRGETAKLMSGMAAQNLKATVAAQAYTGQMTELARLMQDTASKNGYVQSQQKIAQMNNQLLNQNRELQARIQALKTSEGQLNEALKVQLRHKQQMATEDQRSSLASQKLQRTLQQLNTEQAESDAILKALIASRRSEQGESTRLDATLRGLERAYASLKGGQQQQIAEAQALVAARKQEITEDLRLQAETERLRRALAGLTGGRQEEIAKLQAQIAARKRVITEGQTERKVVDELTEAIKREEAALTRLQAQAQLSSTAHGRRVTALRQEIAEQTRHNQLISMSTAALLGFGAQQRRVNISQELGSQSAAMLRAGLTGLHASVGMYTSATVLAATATYGISAALRDSVITGAEFQATMSRTEAIMSSVPSWMKDTATANKAMEMQVRALGQTTVFTASEVGEGLQQLGMAGFATNDAMTALPGTLTLANLANVSMARSADIATNVLMTFNMQAKDLTGVVDLMATAVNNSNTDIEQLANALSYAGPAAQTAGISLKDTVAAVEALANSGIKGSRAGSALRRLFTSLLNPTKKGAEVIRQYGLDIVDAEGKTRSLTNIIGQLSNALKNVPGPERLSAIQDLVGLYATSPVAALIDQADNFQKFRAQNENTAGAGERMEKMISDNLKFDWKELLSALEEVQLQAFDSMGMRLRELTADLTKSVLDLMEPVKTVGDVDITGLDRLMVRAQTAAESLAYLVGGVVAYKFANGSMFSAFSADAKGAGERLTILSQRMSDIASGMRTTAYSTTAASTALQVQNRTAVLAAGGLSTLAASTSAVAAGMSRLATYAGMAMRALGWVGLIYGIGSALYEVFSSNTDEKVLEHKNSVDDVKSSYEKLKEEIEATGLARQRAAAALNIKAQQQSVTQLKAQITTRKGQIADAERLGLDPAAIDALKKDLGSLEGQVSTYENQVEEAKKTLANLGTTTLDYNSAVDQQGAALEDVIRLTNELSLAQKNLAATSRTGINNLNGQTNVSLIQQNLNAARARFNGSGTMVEQVRTSIPTVESQFAKFDETAQASAEAAAYKKTASVSQQLLDLDVKRNAELTYRQSLMAQDASARAANKQDLIPGAQIVEASNQRLLAYDKQRLELTNKQEEQENQLRLAREASNAASRNDAENQVALKQRMLEIDSKIRAAENPEKGKAVDLEKLTGLYREQTQVRQQLAAIDKRDSRAGKKATNDEAREVEQAARAYESLAKKFDALSYAQIQLDEGIKAMTLLRSKNRITAEQEAKAVGELNQKHYEAVRAQNLLLTALDKTRSSLNNSPYASIITDLSTLNRALDAGMLKVEEHARLTANIYQNRSKSVGDSLPKASMSLGQAASTPFTDMMSSVMTGIEDRKGFANAQRDVSTNRDNQMAALNDQFKQRLDLLQSQKLIEQGQEQEHVRRMMEINQDYANQKTALVDLAARDQQTIVAKQAEYEKQSGEMLKISMMSSFSDILGMFAATGEDATAAQKAAFVAQKAIAVAQIIMYTEMAAMQAMAAPDVPLFSMKIPAAAAIRAIGYASAGLTAGLAIGQLSSGKSSGGGTQMYDTGGYIPYNRTGVVGEYGPELVTGPAHVRGRGSSSSTMGGDGSFEPHITLAPVINITPPATGSGGDTRKDAAEMGNAVVQIVMKQLRDAVRPNGFLDNWLRSSRRG